MTNKIGMYIFFVLLLLVLSVGINNKTGLSEESSEYFKPEGNTDTYKDEAVLPEGWRYKINTSNLPVPTLTGETPNFTLTISNPDITCEKKVRHQQYAAVFPYIILYFYDKWDIFKWRAFEEQKIKLRLSAKPFSAPALFIETDRYTIFTYATASCPGKPIQEIEDYLKSYLEKYNDFGVDVIVRAVKEDEIKTAVFLYQFEQNPYGLQQDIKVCFLSVGDPVLEYDPTDDFLKRFQGQPFAVKKVSQCQTNAGVEDKETGLKGEICQVTNIKWINYAEVEVNGGIYFDLWIAGGYIYHVVWENDKWVVKKAKPSQEY